MDIEVNYKNKKRYKSRVKPMRQRGFWVWLIWLLSKILLLGKKYTVEKPEYDNDENSEALFDAVFGGDINGG